MKHLKEYDNEGLLKDLRDLSLALTDDEERMLIFIEEFGADKDPEEFAEYLYDYEKNPEEFEIDSDGDYYNTISDYSWAIEDYKRFDLEGPMKMSNSERWHINKIENSDVYKLYLKISKHK